MDQGLALGIFGTVATLVFGRWAPYLANRRNSPELRREGIEMQFRAHCTASRCGPARLFFVAILICTLSPLHAQDPTINAKTVNIGGSCTNIIMVDSNILAEAGILLPYDGTICVGWKNRTSDQLFFLSRTNLRQVGDSCFRSDPEDFAKGYLEFLLDCRITAFSVTVDRAKEITFSIQAQDESQGGTQEVEVAIRNLSKLLESSIVFPAIIKENDEIYFSAVPPIPIYKGDWWLERAKARRIGTLGNRIIFAVAVPNGLAADQGINFSYQINNGNDFIEVKISLPYQVQVLSLRDQLIEGSCSKPGEKVLPGDVICIERSGFDPSSGWQEEATFESGDGSSKLFPVARSSQVLYFRIPDIRSDKGASLSVGGRIYQFATKSSREASGRVYNCDCVPKDSIQVSVPSALSEREIEALKNIVETALNKGEKKLAEEWAKLRALSKGTSYERSSLIMAAEQAKVAALEGFLTSPRLIGLRDYLEEAIDESIAPFNTPISTAGYGAHAVVTASTGERADVVPKARGDILLDHINKIFSFVRAESEQPLVSLEVKTDPTGALFSMHPKSYGELKYETASNGKLVNVWIGNYSYVLKRRNFADVKGEVDLIRDRRPMLRCNIYRSGTGQGICSRE